MNTQFTHSAGILLLAASVSLASCSIDKKEKETGKSNAITVQVGTPSQQSINKITVSGQVESQETALISTRVMGFISSIKVKPGDKVQKGQLLVSINNNDILAKRAQAMAMVAEAEAALKDAKADYERYKELYSQQSASAKELENMTLRYNSVKAKVEAALQMKNETEAMLAYTNLVAPFSGVITQKHTEEGSMASPGMPILTLEQPNAYHVKAFVSETEVGKLREGMMAEITIKSTGNKINGKITEISPSSQFTGGQFQIKITVPANQNAGLFSGMYANVNIPVKNAVGVRGLFVPVSALIHKDQLTGLYTVNEEKTAQLRWLKVGKEYGDEVEVLSGLNGGEKFITQSEGRLYNGVTVLVR